MPAIPTGSRPVALTPVPAHEFGPRSHPGSSQANRDPLVYASTNAQASSHGHGVTGLASTSPTPFPTPNPHSLRGTVGCPPNRDFVPWRFSDAGLSGARTVCVCRHPKTCTRADMPWSRPLENRWSRSLGMCSHGAWQPVKVVRAKQASDSHRRCGLLLR